MSTSQLTLYNGALRTVGQSRLATLTDSGENRRLLDDAWDENFRDEVLESGNWNFATRASKIEYDASIEPDFGFPRAFVKPTDWLRTTTVASDGFFTNPLVDREYNDEQGYIFASIDSIYLKYVSNDTSYGYDLSLWPPSFVSYAEAYFGLQIAPKLVQDKDTQDKIAETVERLHTISLSKDALNEGVKFPPESGWASARRGRGRSGRNDLGSRSNLTG